MDSTASNAFALFLSIAFSLSLLFLIFSLLFRIFNKRISAKNTGRDDQELSTRADLPDVCGPNGETILAYAGPKRKPLPKPNDEICIINRSVKTTSFTCGHVGPKWFQLNLYGLTSEKIDRNGPCPDCFITYLQQFTARCALCGLPIQPGDGVALYHESSPGLKYKDKSVRVGDSYIGCMRNDCCPSGGFFAGYWTSGKFQSAWDKDEVASDNEESTPDQPAINTP